MRTATKTKKTKVIKRKMWAFFCNKGRELSCHDHKWEAQAWAGGKGVPLLEVEVRILREVKEVPKYAN